MKVILPCFSLLLPTFLVLSSSRRSDAASCNLPEAEGCPHGTCKCGPEYLTDVFDVINVGTSGEAAGVDSWKIFSCDPFWPFNCRTDVFNFRNFCAHHDDCHNAIEAYPTDCERKFERCNLWDFKQEMHDECNRDANRIPSCARNYCKNLLADNFFNVVDNAEEGYREEFGCTNNGNVYSIKSYHNTYLKMVPKKYEKAGTADKFNTWEKWDLQQMDESGGKWAFYNIEHRMYLCAGSDGTVKSVPWIREWELFTLVEVDKAKGQYAFKSHHGTYLRAWPESRSGHKIDLADLRQSYEVWTINPPVPKTRSEVFG